MYSILLLAFSIVVLAVAVIVLERRVSALEKPFSVSVDDLKRANELQSYCDSVADLRRSEGFQNFLKDVYSRPCAEDESVE